MADTGLAPVGPVPPGAAPPSTASPAPSAGPPPPPSRRGLPAGIMSRSLAFSLDLLVLSVLWSTGVFVLQAIVNVFDLQFTVENVVQLAGAALTALVLLVIYHTTFSALFGRTPGKILLGLQVVGADGQPLHTRRAFLRTLAYAVSAILFLGFLWIAIDDRRQGWHDKIARTLVLYEWESRDAARVRR